MSAVASDLTGRVVLVTGAARGIGRAVAEAAAAAGATVAAVDVRPEVTDLGPLARVADASSVDEMAALVADLELAGHRVDAVVANAGEAAPTATGTPLAAAVETFDRMLTANLRTAYVAVRAAIPHLVAAGRGDVVLVSTDHVVPRPGSVPKAGFMEAYDAAKWALEGLRRNWAVTLGRAGVRVNTVAMGETDTPMLREFLADRGTAPDRIDEMSAEWMTAADVAGVIVALLADDDPARTDTSVGLWPGFPVELPPR